MFFRKVYQYVLCIFFNNGAQLSLIFQTLYYTLERLGDTEKIVSWKSKDFSVEKHTAPITIDNSFLHQLNGMGIQIFVLYLKEAA